MQTTCFTMLHCVDEGKMCLNVIRFTCLVPAHVGKDMKSSSEMCGTYKTNTATASNRVTSQ
jgi:hypothetical protein